jgi:hypothetical protein
VYFEKNKEESRSKKRLISFSNDCDKASLPADTVARPPVVAFYRVNGFASDFFLFKG